MLAHQLGFALPDEVAASGIGKSCGRNAGCLAAPAAILGSHPRAQERSIKDEFGYFGSNRFIAAAKDNPTASVTNKEE